ncbi:MAG: glycosyltransferase 87 family protein [Promethearchaeota archaeon]
MKLAESEYGKEQQESYLLIYIVFIIMITAVLISLRIIFIYIQEEPTKSFFINLLVHNRDLNFKTNYELMQNGITHYYDENALIDERAIYLYFWYFIFYPFYLMPLDISLYIWDLFRIISTIYIAIKISKITNSKRDLLFYFLLSSIGYVADMYLNNTNWIIQFFIYESYIQLDKNKKFLSGIFFALSMFKITLAIFPLLLLIIKRIKIKDFLYYVIPFTLICIPYLIFPNYLLKMISNWFHSIDYVSGFSLVNFFFVLWRLIQPAHLMFICIILVIILLNIKKESLKQKISSWIYLFVFVVWGFIWLILLEVAIFV